MILSNGTGRLDMNIYKYQFDDNIPNCVDITYLTRRLDSIFPLGRTMFPASSGAGRMLKTERMVVIVMNNVDSAK